MTKIEHTCPRGHWVEAKHQLTTCPAYVKGKACEQPLKRIGKGSRVAEREVVAS